MKHVSYAVVGAGLLLFVLAAAGLHAQTAKEGAVMKITSAAFSDGGMIPVKHTCDGADVSPPLSWSGVPEEAKSLALVCDDPDAPAGTWVHWVLYDMPPDAAGLPEGVPPAETLESGARHGINDFRKYGFGGPCPPGGTHRYYFKLYALDSAVGLAAGASKERLLQAVKGHVLAEAVLMGRYTRTR